MGWYAYALQVQPTGRGLRQHTKLYPKRRATSVRHRLLLLSPHLWVSVFLTGKGWFVVWVPCVALELTGQIRTLALKRVRRNTTSVAACVTIAAPRQFCERALHVGSRGSRGACTSC